MIVSMNFDERPDGFFIKRTRIYLTVTVEFSDEEKQTILQRNLEQTTVERFWISDALVKPALYLTQKYTPNGILNVLGMSRYHEVEIQDLVRYKTFVYANGSAAYMRDLEASLKHGLQFVKDLLHQQSDLRTGKQVFEL